MAEAKTSSLVQIKKRTAALSMLGATDLSDQVKMAAMVRTAKDVNDQKKALDEQDGLVKAEFKRMARQYTDAGKSVTVYDFDDQMKMTLSVSDRGSEIDEKALVKQIYDFYGETVGDKGGRAWKAYCAISDPMEAPRKLNLEKLEYEVKKAERVQQGLEYGDVNVTAAMVSKSMTEAKRVVTAKVSSMNKDEKQMLKTGELKDTLKVE